MKKKRFIIMALVLALSVMFANSSYAEAVKKKITAVFNSYVIKLNGTTQKTETLATGSKVYIPITQVPKLTGATVKKSGNTYSITSADKEQIKIMVRVMDMYNKFEGKLDGPSVISPFIHRSFDELKYNNSTYEYNRTIVKYNFLLKVHEDTIYEINDLVKSSAAGGYNMRTDENHFSSIMSDYENSLTYIKKSLLNLKDYHQTGNDKYENEYVNNLNKGLDYSFKGRKKALIRYNYYLNAINKK